MLSVAVYRMENFALTLVVVRAEVPEGWTHVELVDKISDAVTDWAQIEPNDPTLLYAGEDFNIGDLCSCNYQDGPLREALERHGVKNLVIEGFDTQHDWTYDQPLIYER